MNWLPFETLDKSTKTRNVYKVLVIGDGFVGKTAITVRFCEDRFQDDYKTTIGVDFGTKHFRYRNDTYALMIWDIAGQERFRVMRPNYYAGSLGVLLVYDVTNRLTFLDLPNWVAEIQKTIGNVPMLLAGNKMDLVNGSGELDPRTGEPYQKEVTFVDGRKFANSLNSAFLETSAKEAHNIPNLFVMLVDAIEGDVRSSVLPINTFESVQTGFEKLEEIVARGHASIGGIFDNLMRLKQSIFEDNPYSVVLGNLSEWIQFLPKINYGEKVQTLLSRSIYAWKHHYSKSLQDGIPVTADRISNANV